MQDMPPPPSPHRRVAAPTGSCLVRFGLALLVPPALAACGANGMEDDDDVRRGVPTEAVTIGAAKQNGTVGAAVAHPPAVMVRDALGAGVTNVKVVFEITAGNGRIEPNGRVSTTAGGIAQLDVWILGAADGGENRVTATVPTVGAPTTHTFEALAGNLPSLTSSQSIFRMVFPVDISVAQRTTLATTLPGSFDVSVDVLQQPNLFPDFRIIPCFALPDSFVCTADSSTATISDVNPAYLRIEGLAESNTGGSGVINQGIVRVAATGVVNPKLDLTVILSADAQEQVSFDEPGMSFVAAVGAALQPDTVLMFNPIGGSDLEGIDVVSQASWLDGALVDTLSPRELLLEVTVDPSALGLGQDSGALELICGGCTFASQGTTLAAFPVQVVIYPPPVIQLSSTSISFDVQVDDTSIPSVTVRVTNGGSGALDGLAASPDVSWISATLTGDVTATNRSADIVVTPLISDLSPGRHTATVRVTSIDPDIAPTSFQITLNLRS